MLAALPRRVIRPFCAETFVAEAFTFLWNRSVSLTLVTSQALLPVAGPSLFRVSLLSTLFTPGMLATVSRARSLWDSSDTVPVRVASPPLDTTLMLSPLRYVLKT